MPRSIQFLLMVSTLAFMVIGSSSSEDVACQSPRSCNWVTCPVIADDCYRHNGTLLPNSTGKCNCCSLCVVLLGNGESCADEFLIPGFIKKNCSQGLSCDNETKLCASYAHPQVAAFSFKTELVWTVFSILSLHLSRHFI